MFSCPSPTECSPVKSMDFQLEFTDMTNKAQRLWIFLPQDCFLYLFTILAEGSGLIAYKLSTRTMCWKIWSLPIFTKVFRLLKKKKITLWNGTDAGHMTWIPDWLDVNLNRHETPPQPPPPFPGWTANKCQIYTALTRDKLRKQQNTCEDCSGNVNIPGGKIFF